MIKIMIKRKKTAEDLPLPRYMSSGSAGMDLYAAVDETTEIAPGGFGLIPTGIHLQLPAGYEGQLRPRSGLAKNSVETVGCGLGGGLSADRKPTAIKRGDREHNIISRYEKGETGADRMSRGQ